MKLTEIGMIFNLHGVRNEQGRGLVEFQDLFDQGAGDKWGAGNLTGEWGHTNG